MDAMLDVLTLTEQAYHMAWHSMALDLSPRPCSPNKYNIPDYGALTSFIPE